MHGLGDCLHQRSVIRELEKEFDVWLETSWPCVYHDFPGLKMLAKGTRLRTQLKNASREADLFTRADPPAKTEVLRIHYPPKSVGLYGSVLRAMSHHAGVKAGDFRIPVRDEWLAKADHLLAWLKPTKPVMFFRPLVARTEWTGGLTRNPDPEGYWRLFEAIRERFFVISVADLVPGVEWLCAAPIETDAAFHRGELDVETLFGLAKRSALMFGAPGFVTVMGQAVGTPTVTIFGGYEDARSFSSGAALSPWLSIEPIRPCACWTHTHNCTKAIDIPAATARLLQFVEEQRVCA